MSGVVPETSLMDELNPPSSSDPQNGTPTFSSTPPPRLPFLHDMFIGPEGLRAGWRFLLYLTMGGTILYVLGWTLEPLLNSHVHGTARLWASLAEHLVLVTGVVVPAFIMGRIERRPFDAYGLPRRNAFEKLFWVGAVWGLVSITILLVVMRGAGAFYFGGLALHGTRVVKFALYWGVFFLLVGFFEEFLFRGYTLFTVKTGIGFWPAAILLSAGFGGVHLHNAGENWLGVLAAGLIGFFFCLTLRRTGNLWFAVGFHAAWDWGESFLYSVPDSGEMVTGHLLKSSFRGPTWLTGGSVGPEGSVLVFILIALLWVAFNRLYPEVKYPG